MQIAEPLGHGVIRQPDVHRHAVFLQMRHGLRPIHSAAARGDDALARKLQPREHAVFHLQEPLDALAVQNAAERAALLPLNGEVAVHKIAAQRLGQHDPDRTLARAGHPDHNDILAHFSASPSQNSHFPRRRHRRIHIVYHKIGVEESPKAPIAVRA